MMSRIMQAGVPMPLQKPWRRWEAGSAFARTIPNTLGVYEIADEHGGIVYIGLAGGKSLFGLRGELARQFEGQANAVAAARGRQFRYAENMQSLTRFRDLLHASLR